MEIKNFESENESRELGTLLLDIGVSLLEAGASCTRTMATLVAFAGRYEYQPHIVIGARSVSLSLNNAEGHTLYNGTRTTSSHGIDFTMLSSVNALARRAGTAGLSLESVREELGRYVHNPYPRPAVLFFVGLADAAFCFTFGGGPIEMLMTFCATACGLFVKQQVSRNRLNPYACTYIAAVVGSMFIAAVNLTGILGSPVHAFSASVLFLVPGVFLINSFTDVLDGNTIIGIERGTIALCHILAIALGLSTTLIIFNPGS